DREIYSRRDTAANTINIRSGRQAIQHDLLLRRCRDQVTVCIQQLKVDLLVAMILIDLSIEVRAAQLERNFDKRLPDIQGARISLVKSSAAGCRRCRTRRWGWSNRR